MDRATTNIAKAQGGFIDGLIKPAFENFKILLPPVEANIKNLMINKAQWAQLEDEYDVTKNAINKETSLQKLEAHILDSDRDDETDSDLMSTDRKQKRKKKNMVATPHQLDSLLDEESEGEESEDENEN